MELLIRHCAETVVSTGNKKKPLFRREGIYAPEQNISGLTAVLK